MSEWLLVAAVAVCAWLWLLWLLGKWLCVLGCGCGADEYLLYRIMLL